MNLKYSIIVPVYNTEQYIKKCIDSLVNQTYRNIEIIIIDDGSTDGSKLIYSSYSDTRIKLFYKENSGLSDTRNFGLSKASGNYILFLDSDDYYDVDAIDRLNYVINNNNELPEIISISLKKVLPNEEIFDTLTHTNQSHINMKGIDFLKNEMLNGTMHMAAVMKVYSRTFLIEKKLFFKSRILHEDEEFTPRALLVAEKILPTSLDFYNYVIHENSITTSKASLKNFTDLFNTLSELEILYKKIDDNETKKIFMNNLLEKYLYMYAKANIYKKEYITFQHKEFVHKKANNLKNKMKVLLFSISDSLYCYIYRKKENKRS